MRDASKARGVEHTGVFERRATPLAPMQRRPNALVISRRALRRANHARALLKQGMRLADIALAAGYFDQAQFTRDFRRVVGVPPRRYLHRRSQHILQHHVAR